MPTNSAPVSINQWIYALLLLAGRLIALLLLLLSLVGCVYLRASFSRSKSFAPGILLGR